MPWKAVMVPRVTMKGTSLSRLISAPLTSPQRQPVSSPPAMAMTESARVASSGEVSRQSDIPSKPSRYSQAIDVAVSAIAVPADRSMPPAMMINVMPSAATPTSDA